MEKHWNGDLLDSIEAVLGFAGSMTWKGKNPLITFTDKIYETGIKVEKKVMELYETAIKRAYGLERWFIILYPRKCKIVLEEEI